MQDVEETWLDKALRQGEEKDSSPGSHVGSRKHSFGCLPRNSEGCRIPSPRASGPSRKTKRSTASSHESSRRRASTRWSWTPSPISLESPFGGPDAVS